MRLLHKVPFVNFTHLSKTLSCFNTRKVSLFHSHFVGVLKIFLSEESTVPVAAAAIKTVYFPQRKFLRRLASLKLTSKASHKTAKSLGILISSVF